MKQGIILSMFLSQVFCTFGMRISQKKCQDYQAIVSSVSDSEDVDKLLEYVDPKEFPFMAKVYGLFLINGLLISENYVLTIGYSDLFGTPRAYVVLGDSSSRTGGEGQRFLIIQHVKSSRDNLSLLKLNASVEFNQFIRPVCLSEPGVTITQPLTEVSWDLKNMLRKEKRDLLANAMCNRTHVDGPGRTRMCACRKVSACNYWSAIFDDVDRDSHGSALLNGPQASRSNEVVGIKMENFASGCAKGIPEEYVRISSYLDWIESNVWPNRGSPTAADYVPLPTYVVLVASINYLN